MLVHRTKTPTVDGVRVVRVFLANPWTQETRVSLEDGIHSINPLELLAAAQLFLDILDHGKIPREVQTALIRVDNASACSCINMGRALPKL